MSCLASQELAIWRTASKTCIRRLAWWPGCGAECKRRIQQIGKKGDWAVYGHGDTRGGLCCHSKRAGVQRACTDWFIWTNYWTIKSRVTILRGINIKTESSGVWFCLNCQEDSTEIASISSRTWSIFTQGGILLAFAKISFLDTTGEV